MWLCNLLACFDRKASHLLRLHQVSTQVFSFVLGSSRRNRKAGPGAGAGGSRAYARGSQSSPKLDRFVFGRSRGEESDRFFPATQHGERVALFLVVSFGSWIWWRIFGASVLFRRREFSGQRDRKVLMLQQNRKWVNKGSEDCEERAGGTRKKNIPRRLDRSPIFRREKRNCFCLWGQRTEAKDRNGICGYKKFKEHRSKLLILLLLSIRMLE